MTRRLIYVGKIDAEKIRRTGLKITTADVYVSADTIEKIQTKHKDLTALVQTEAAVIDSINTVISTAEYVRRGPLHNVDGIILYGPVGSFYVCLVLILREDGARVATIHGFKKRRAVRLFNIGDLGKWA